MMGTKGWLKQEKLRTGGMRGSREGFSKKGHRTQWCTGDHDEDPIMRETADTGVTTGAAS